MKFLFKKFLLSLTMANVLFAADPIDLVKKDACVWNASKEGDGEEKTLVINKGCPDFYTKKCKNVKVDFVKKKIEEEDILIVDWSFINSTADGKTKLSGKMKFVVGEYNGEENLYAYEGMVDCKGAVCKSVLAPLEPIGQLFQQLGLPFSFDIWGKTFGVGMESAMYNANHDMNDEILTQVLMSAMLGGRASSAQLDPVIFNSFIVGFSKGPLCKEE